MFMNFSAVLTEHRKVLQFMVKHRNSPCCQGSTLSWKSLILKITCSCNSEIQKRAASFLCYVFKGYKLHSINCTKTIFSKKDGYSYWDLAHWFQKSHFEGLIWLFTNLLHFICKNLDVIWMGGDDYEITCFSSNELRLTSCQTIKAESHFLQINETGSLFATTATAIRGLQLENGLRHFQNCFLFLTSKQHQSFILAMIQTLGSEEGHD